ncbi:hypothetical protein QN350_17265 [Cryobacterium sp. 10I5]|nr:hypothetical protein [Cryobacterium sp. 10I5]MEB0267583.1 hypothetical protein [Cryobacterium sp. 10I5]
MIRGAIFDAVANHNNRKVDIEARHIPWSEGERVEDEPVDGVAAHRRYRAHLISVRSRLFDKYRVAARIRGTNDSVRKFGEVRLAQLRNRKPDHPRPPGSQVPRRYVYLIVQLPDSDHDPFPHPARDVRVTRQNIRNGLH